MMSPTPGQPCCTSQSIAPWKADLDAIWEEIATLREGQPLIVRAVELYDPHLKLWPDGEIEDAGRACWDTLNAAFRQSAEAHGVPVVSGYDWLNGEKHDQDLHAMGLMQDDFHLNEAGVKLLVELLRGSGYDYGVVQP
jgi:hypothetical protein